ncbi:uncharacterized protein LOC131570430 [Ammospiza caudacuta]|uniref:uncharacterized protein LOC131570430 n=1 Tax=Ammospiza caudacuta TaxID=2857398 RepID=UPI0027392654|nr:uncharacterized protein LOC131570430 [Ammospiza caudacuta]
MGSRASRPVEIQVTNNTETINLRNPKTYFYSGRSLHDPHCLVPPCSSTVSKFTNRSIFWGCNGVLAFEAETFTLAIFFSNPIDRNRFSVLTGLELSLDKVHKGDLRSAYRRMVRSSRPRAKKAKKAKSPPRSPVLPCAVLKENQNQRKVQLSHGAVTVAASLARSGGAAVIKVEVIERRNSGVASGLGLQVEHDTPRRKENVQGPCGNPRS